MVDLITPETPADAAFWHWPASRAVDALDPDAPARPSPWLTVQQGAAYAAVSADSIYSAIQRRELKHVRIGGRRSIRLRAEWIDAWLDRQARGGAAA